ncbi:MAG: hypothetical protein V4558_06460 [Gemmatimonadota bacterium]
MSHAPSPLPASLLEHAIDAALAPGAADTLKAETAVSPKRLAGA